MRIAVCDDDKTYLQDLVDMIEKWADQSDVSVELFSFNNGDELVDKCKNVCMDVVFLDVLMPLLNGIDTARELRKTDTAARIVFLTSSPEFALESYSVRAFNYLLKPVCFETLKEVLDECHSAFIEEPQYLVLKTHFGYQKIYCHNIEYIEAQNKKVVFYLCSGEELEVYEPLKVFEDKLIDGFFKCHRSYLVYLPNVDHFNNSKIITKSNRTIPIARSYSKAFQEAYLAFAFS